MRRDLQKLAQRYDSIAIIAPVQKERPKSPVSRVTFQEPPAQVGRGRGYGVLQALRGGSFGKAGKGRAGRGYQVMQALRGGGRGNFRGNTRKTFQPQQNYLPQQEMNQFGQHFDPTQTA